MMEMSSLRSLSATLLHYLTPARVTLLAVVVLVSIAIWQAGGDAIALARLGERFSQGDPRGPDTEHPDAGYDGQFVYYMARDLDPQRVQVYLDVPAYRYQRILLPLLARLLSLGDPSVIPWALVVINGLALVGGTWAVQQLLQGWGVSRWYALVYGLWPGFLLALTVDLPEPLAYGLTAAGLLACQRGRQGWGWLLLGLAAFAKEVALIFALAAGLSALAERRWQDAAGVFFIAGLPYALFQGWLWLTFGQPGIGSGGDMATPFEWLPFMGLLRIYTYSPLYLAGMLVVFGPTIVWPAIWGMIKGVQYFRTGGSNVVVWGLFLNSLAVAFLPFSTFRETGAILRLGCGLVLAVLLFAGYSRQRRVLNYSIFWLVLNVFLLK